MKKIVIVLLFFLTACFYNKKKSVNVISKDTNLVNFDNLVDDEIIKNDFNIFKYKIKVDSLLSVIEGETTSSKIIFDTLDRDDLVFVELKDTPLYCLTKEAYISKKYSFSLSKGDSRLNHYFVNLEFANVAKADSIFSIFEKIALEKSGIPGLTYSNDFLVQVENKIYWINSSCSFSYANHLKLVNIFKNMVNIDNKIAVECECGHVKCITHRQLRIPLNNN